MIQAFLADEKWNAQLCDLMRSVYMSGNIDIIYARDPDFFQGVRIKGKENRVMAVAVNNRLVVSMTVSMKPVYINKKAVNAGYVNSLRICDDERNKMILGIGYRFFKNIHDPTMCPVYFSSIIESNRYAKKILLRKKSYWIKNLDLGKYFTYAIIMNKKKRKIKPVPGITVLRGNSVPLIDIIRFINLNGRNKQFFPVYEVSDFHSPYCMDFSCSDFYIAKQGDEIIGVKGKWDQQKIKQHIVSRYHGILKIVKPLINGILQLTGYHSQPNPGEKLKYFYISFVCIKDDRSDVLACLLDHILADHVCSEYHLCMIGFHEKDLLRKAIRHYVSIHYISRLYCFYFQDGIDFIRSFDHSLIPYLETATL